MDIGGQAVIEGVMMRNKEHFAVAVRMPDGSIKVKKEKANFFPKYFNIPFIRGFIGLGYTVYDGMRALIWSSQQQETEEEEALSKKELFFTIAASFIFTVLVFVVVPFFAARWIHSDGILFDALDGVFRIALFIGYLLIIARMKDVQTLFRYHGAEHKAIACYEGKEKLTVENVRKYTRFHPRCGTSFVFIVLILSIIVFTLIPGNWVVKLVGRIVALPLIAGIGYEIIKFSAKFQKNFFVKGIIAPGLWLQRLTTKEPTDKQIEVGIKSLEAVLK